MLDGPGCWKPVPPSAKRNPGAPILMPASVKIQGRATWLEDDAANQLSSLFTTPDPGVVSLPYTHSSPCMEPPGNGRERVRFKDRVWGSRAPGEDHRPYHLAEPAAPQDGHADPSQPPTVLPQEHRFPQQTGSSTAFGKEAVSGWVVL